MVGPGGRVRAVAVGALDAITSIETAPVLRTLKAAAPIRPT
jgi:hypothetical protein